MRTASASALVLLGERSALHDAPQAAARLRLLAPTARVELVPDAGHALPCPALPTDDPAAVAAGILGMAAHQAG
ncbi:hypothetical protein [Streptomyces sp. NRRL S-350]|uniref:hypothetical protein n=1 Tax=Streptomyces sp. NRRL S-350 TaxID=1463902 RepID=UPI0004BED509|nr:hypothetical protein [Streptomyces sp. NRRL S-350]